MFGPRFYQLFGQGESPMTISGLPQWMHADIHHPRYEERLGSTGLARTGCVYKIVDPTGRPLPAGEVGEIITKSDATYFIRLDSFFIFSDQIDFLKSIISDYLNSNTIQNSETYQSIKEQLNDESSILVLFNDLRDLLCRQI